MRTILILSANPKNTNPLRLDEEVREIQICLERSRQRDQFNVITRSALRIDDLRRTLLDHQPQIVHFSGHGAGTNGLALENSSGQLQLVSTEALAKLFGLFREIECVVLNACYSKEQAQEIHQQINCVVGMNQAIGDRAAIQFAIGFYDGLGAGSSYDDAFQIGCSNIDLQGISASSIPVLLSRPSQAVLPSEEAETQKTKGTSSDKAPITMTINGDNGKQIGSIESVENFTM